MKKIFKTFLMLLIASLVSAQDLKVPSQGKSLVYFTRYDAAGFLINFKYFDGDKYLGKFNHGKYLIYECEPGNHVFWAKSENIDFIDANLKADKTYIIDSKPQMGAIKAGVKLVVFNKQLNNYDRYKKRIFKSLENGKPYVSNEQEIKKDEEELKELIIKGLEKFNKLKLNKESSKIEFILPEMYYEKTYFKVKDLTNK